MEGKVYGTGDRAATETCRGSGGLHRFAPETALNPNLPLLWEKLRSAYWFYPGLLLAAGIAAAFGLIAVDERIGDRFRGTSMIYWIYQGGADGARAMLAAIATAVLGVAGITFSITVAILSLTTSQFGPTLLRNFLRDTANQIVLGTFIATFLYCLLVMRMVHSVEESSFVPHVSVTFGVLLAIVSTAMLVYFIHHVVATIQAANFIAKAGEQLMEAVDRLYPHELGDPAPVPEIPRGPDRAAWTPLKALRSGYVQVYDAEGLLALSRDCGATIELLRAPGEFATIGTPIALARGGVDAAQYERRLDEATTLGPQSTELQDITLPVNALAEIAMRALSPSINDPHTAQMCVDRLCAAFAVLIGREFPSRTRADKEGCGHVIARAPSFADLVHQGLDPVRRYGRQHVEVLLKILDALLDIESCNGNPERRRVLAEVADQVLEAGEESLPLEDDRRVLRKRYAELKERLAGRRDGSVGLAERSDEVHT